MSGHCRKGYFILSIQKLVSFIIGLPVLWRSESSSLLDMVDVIWASVCWRPPCEEHTVQHSKFTLMGVNSAFVEWREKLVILGTWLYPQKGVSLAFTGLGGP
jgi:hypothetical protein